VAGRWAIARIGLDHDELLYVSRDRGPVLLNRARNNHRHELRDCRWWIRAVAGLTRPRGTASRHRIAVLEALEGFRARPARHRVVLLPMRTPVVHGGTAGQVCKVTDYELAILGELERRAEVANAVAIGVALIRIRRDGAVVRSVGHTVVVVVWIADVALCVAVVVSLIRIRRQRAVIRAVCYAVVIIVRIADVSLRVAVRVGLVGIGDELTVVECVVTAENFRMRGGISRWSGDGDGNDSAGSNHLTLNNGAHFAEGKFGQAFAFDGGDDSAQASTTGFPIGNADRTLEMWVKLDAFVTEENFFGGYGNFGSYSQTYSLSASGTSLLFSQWGDSVSGRFQTLEVGKWYHIAVTNEGAGVTLYLDGTILETGNVPINTPAGTPFIIGWPGSTYGEIRKLKGVVDEVRIYNRALAPEEIAANYDTGK